MSVNKWQQYRQRTVGRHVSKYRQLAEAYEAADDLSILRAEHANLQSAVSQAIEQQKTEELQRLAWSLGRPFDGQLSLDGHWPELVNLLKETIRLSEAQNQVEIAAAFRVDLATVQMWQGKMAAAQADYHEALVVLNSVNQTPRIQSVVGTIYQHLGNLSLNMTDYPVARKHYENALSWQRQMNNRLGVAKSLHQLGVLAVKLADFEEARLFYKESLAISQSVENKGQIALTTWNLGNLAYYEGKFGAANDNYRQALVLFEVMDDQRNQAGVLHSFGQLAVDQGNFVEAREYAERSLRIKVELGNRMNQPITLGLLGVISYGEGDREAAESLFQQAISLALEVGDLRELNNQRFNLAMLYQDQNRLTESIQLLEAVVATDEKLGLPSLDKDKNMLALVQERVGQVSVMKEGSHEQS